MARYTGPTCRLCRHLGDKLTLKGDKCSTAKCPFERRSRPTRGRTSAQRRSRISDRGLQLREKQKVRFSYGVLERQFRCFFAKAAKSTGSTGENVLILMERRLDNVVYRLGFASSRSQARQIVRHGHILVNGHKVNIPSYVVKSGDVIKWREGSTKTEYYKKLIEEIGSKNIPGWLSLDKEKLIGSILTLPDKNDLDPKFDVKAIVKYYSR